MWPRARDAGRQRGPRRRGPAAAAGTVHPDFTATVRPPLEDWVTEHSKGQGQTRGKPGAASGGHVSRLDSQPLGFLSDSSWSESRHFRRSAVLILPGGQRLQRPRPFLLGPLQKEFADSIWAMGSRGGPYVDGQVRVLGQEGGGLAVRHQSVCSGLRQLSRRCRWSWAVQVRTVWQCAHALTHTHIHTHIHMYMYLHTYTYTHAHTHTHKSVTCTHSYTHRHAYVLTHIYIHTCSHTHTNP